MRRTLKVAWIAFALLLPVLIGAQEGPPPQEGGGRPPRRQGQGPGDGNPPPRDASFYQGQAIRAIDEKASLLLEQGKTEAAIEAFKQVYTLEVPKNSPFYEGKVRLMGRLAKAYAESGHKPEALDTVKKLIAELPPGTPAEAAGWLEAGSVYKKTGMPDEALKAFDKAIELSKKLAEKGWNPPPPPGGPRPGPEGRRPATGENRGQP